MALKLSLNLPGQPKDEEWEVPGVGLVKNGGSITLSSEQERDFAARHGMSVKDYFKDSEQYKVEGSSETPKGGE